MPDLRISQLPELIEPANVDWLEIVDDATLTNQKVSLQNARKYPVTLIESGDPTAVLAPGDFYELRITGADIAVTVDAGGQFIGQ